MLAGGVLVVLVGWLLQAPALVFAGTTLVVLIVAVTVSLLFRTADVRVARRFSPDRGVAGWSAVETVSVLPRGSRTSGAVRVREQLPFGRLTDSEAAAVLLVPGRASSAVFRHHELPRGRHRIGPLHVDLVESYGVARRRVVADGAAEFVVVPEVVEVGLGRESRALGDGSRRQREHSLAGGEDDPVTREYRRGDPMRRVHWKATARHGELMVRQEEQHGLPSARVVIAVAAEGWSDSRPTVPPSSGFRSKAAAPTIPLVSDAFEWAVSFAATVAVEVGHAGSLTVLATPDGSLVARHDPDSTAAFLDDLADLRLDDELGAPAPAPSPREPVVAVVSGLRRLELDLLVASRAVGSSAVAVVVTPALPLGAGLTSRPARSADGADRTVAPVLTPDEVAGALVDAGWRVVEADSSDDVGRLIVRAGVLDD
ncbi:DUF58 domain-containing protein [Frigoribacterium sp. VKM Ac-1396]|uniref:DUF58 domain-containing protein n=1 Tax=Frigoribacterium sp. VKM Ac-1396 TaxID=2783821 RepID=UPI00188B2489|nr:DUF58 domain-containing protein [Frigoribacterium sp. VKM Ac-1396]